MSRSAAWAAAFVVAATAACGDNGHGPVGPPDYSACGGRADPDTTGRLRMIAGQDQCGLREVGLHAPLELRVVDGAGAPVVGAVVHWSVVQGGGAVGADSSLTDTHGVARVAWTLGDSVGGQFVTATIAGLPDTARFHATAHGLFSVAAGGNNADGWYSSDLWVRGGYAYTGTWGIRADTGNVTKVWSVGAGVTLVDSLEVPQSLVISDNEVSADGTLLLATAEYGAGAGLYVYSLADPAHPVLVGAKVIGGYGLHTGTFADIGGQRYVFAARDPNGTTAPALMVYRIQPDSAAPIVQVAALDQPRYYGIHDTFVRDGLAFVADWDSGLRIYDVGDGRLGGSPASPQLVGSIVTSADGLACNCVHNSWWYHAPDGSKRYLFVGQEGPGTVGTASSGDIHVVDVSDLAHPAEVAVYHLEGAGTHNFWVDEQRGILYAAYYNAGVVALDVTGTLTGDLASREIARYKLGGSGGTYTWGVMLANGSLYATDMLSGLWKVNVP